MNKLTDDQIIEICDSKGLNPRLGLDVGRAILQAVKSRSADALSEQSELRDTVLEVLKKHRMVQMFEVEEDGLGNSYRLIDRLSLEDGANIASGLVEVEVLADAIADAITINYRALRTGLNLLDYAQRLGWQDDGEGAFEFLQRAFYEEGRACLDTRPYNIERRMEHNFDKHSGCVRCGDRMSNECILRWDQRVNWSSTEPASKLVVAAMKEEIDELRSCYKGMTADRDRWERAFNDALSSSGKNEDSDECPFY